MHVLHKDHIVDIFVWVDDALASAAQTQVATSSKGGRQPKLTTSETVTILLFCSLTAPQRLLKGIWRWAHTYHEDDFNMPSYSKFVEHCHKALPALCWLLEQTLASGAPLRFMDSTMLPVCRLVRADRHRVARAIAGFGKNHQGWWYGFKLHAACNPSGQLAAVFFTGANASDSQQIPKLVSDATLVAVGDGGYTAGVMRRKMWREHGTFILSPPHPMQRKKILARWQLTLLRARPRIECLFDYLKEHLLLVTSFPRSVQGYALHYVRTLLAYQLLRGV
jgi:DDE family transposase